MNADSQAQGGRVGRAGGIPNYKNNIIINIISGCSPTAWRHGGRLLLSTRESLARPLFAEGRIFKRTGTKNSATACKSQQVSPVRFRAISFNALILSIAFRLRPATRLFWVWIWQSPATLEMTAQGTTLM
jgi:hypothetical protein